MHSAQIYIDAYKQVCSVTGDTRMAKHHSMILLNIVSSLP